MTLRGFIDECVLRLTPLYPQPEAKTMAVRLLQEFAHVSSYAHLVEPFMVVTSVVEEKLKLALAELSTGRPLQYVLGYEWFCGHKFEVCEGVLIPRPETEELVELILKKYKIAKDLAGTETACVADAVCGVRIPPLQILDICTGSGCIAHSLTYGLGGQAAVHGCDISNVALGVARRQKIYGESPDDAVYPQFFQCDVLCENAEAIMMKNGIGKPDIIVSNPPYVCEKERSLMRGNVLDFEPDIALFVPNDNPLLFYRRIAVLGLSLLTPGGQLFFEINERFGKQTVKMMEKLGYSSCVIIKDINGKERFVYGTK